MLDKKTWPYQFQKHQIAISSLPINFFCRPSEEVAPDLIGCLLVKRESNKKLLWGAIVETEAYSQSEPACHGFTRKTSKNKTLFGNPGRLYVYLTYGSYYCVNIVTHKKDYANGVLLRAIAIPNENERIAAGPGLLANRFGLNRSHDNSLISVENGLWIDKGLSGSKMNSIIQTKRIGISKAKDLPWRWYLQNSRSVSKRAKGDRCPSLLDAWKPSSKEGP
ncbi:3-methyladenine DNA glycosylase [Prochlorococcus marinus subsp. marinus str. CCMP1375]|uniref:Putative 3-methyladenine DNA glycosylase n=2 Tax=Prochlorococcaceae TaxID=2881426 RepID=Q7VDV5_PROMA|nr:3-methyladenine DNA glycosylase [Prochlorococcus marinus subsp. marinus str. CCMP1375]